MAPDRGNFEIVSPSDIVNTMTNLNITTEAEPSSGPLQSTSGAVAVADERTSGTTPPHLSHDPVTNTKRTDPFQFGQRYLSESDDVFAFNAWDHVAPDDSHHAFCEEQYSKQRSSPVSQFDQARFNSAPEKWWDLFYKQKSATFFKDRKWLVQEFPVLHALTRKDAGPKVILEVGAGAGNTAFPILRLNENDELMLHAYDFSKHAVATMRASPDYDEAHMRAEVWDVAASPAPASTMSETAFSLPPGVEANTVDVVILIFIFSALSPAQWTQAVRNVHAVLKPGGTVLFRDYGRGDLAQVRFKAGRWMEENFYVRGDGTRVYFFEIAELRGIWGADGSGEGSREVEGKKEEKVEGGEDESLEQVAESESKQPGGSEQTQQHEQPGLSQETEHQRENVLSGEIAMSGPDGRAQKNPAFEILNLDVDRRLIVNRQRRIKMYRCWIQGRFRKPTKDEDSDTQNSSI